VDWREREEEGKGSPQIFWPRSAPAIVNIVRQLGCIAPLATSAGCGLLLQRLSVLIQRFNSALIMDSFCFSDEDPDL